MLVIVPQRNIETWFAYLDGISVNETVDYNAYKSKDPRPFAEELYRMCHEAQQTQTTRTAIIGRVVPRVPQARTLSSSAASSRLNSPTRNTPCSPP